MKPTTLHTLLPAIAAASALATLSGCASFLSGIGGSEKLSCKAPTGVICTSVSGVYANAATIAARSAPLPDLKDSAPAGKSQNASVTLSLPDRRAHPLQGALRGQDALRSQGALRSSPRVLRLWVAPWEDGDGDLHEASTVHVLADNGRWLIEPIRPSHRSRIDAVAPPAGVKPDSNPPAAAAEAAASNAPSPFAATTAEAFSSFPR